jgi:tetratricopeptide (TPR) repeat protein
MLVFTWFSIRWDIASAVAYRGLDSRQPDSREIADWLSTVAPDDPSVRAESARLFEKTFESDDLGRSLAEYEKAVALSPHHFYLWMLLGTSRDRNGDAEGAEAAYARSLELAPNYSSVRWAYGNSLIRHGKSSEGFAMIAAAAANDPSYANPAAAIALQAFDGDADKAREVLGSGSGINAALAEVLGSQRKFADAYNAWARVPLGDKEKFKGTGERLRTLMLDAKQFRFGVAIDADLSVQEPKPKVGQITNGSFENGLKLRNAGLFEWQIAEGGEPQIGLSESVKRSGQYSLFLAFNSFEASDFRSLWQRIAVEPGATYEMEGFYRADIKSKATFRWQIVNIADVEIGTTEPLTLNGDWATLRATFKVPADSDGVVIRFIRTGCSGGACPVTGRLSFDDFSLKQL